MMRFLYFSRHLSKSGQPCLHVLTPDQSKNCGELNSHPLTHQFLVSVLDRFKTDIDAFQKEQTAWNLILDANLPADWHEYDWESLSCHGRPLAEHALVLRRAKPWGTKRCEQLPDKKIALLNLFPTSQFNFITELQPHFEQGKIEAIYLGSAASQLGKHQELVVVAHGTEEGLQDAKGDRIDLLQFPLPKRVWLLVCNENRAMFRLATQCLKQGVETVVVATGLLEAEAMSQIIQRWLTEEKAMMPAVWLAEWRLDCDAVGGIKALTVYGALAPDHRPVAEWNRKVLQAHSTGKKIEKELDDNYSSFEKAIQVIKSAGEELWPVTLESLLTQALKMSENHDHNKMKVLEQQLRLKGLDSPPVNLAMANCYYRLGRYQSALRSLAQGVNKSYGSEEHEYEYLQLMGLLINISIDMNLPEWGAWALKCHQSIELLEPDHAQKQEYRRLDWQARMAFRQHDFKLAMHWMESKLLDKPIDDSLSNREVIWLLYIQAVAHKNRAQVSSKYNEWLEVAKNEYNQIDQITSKGNSPAGYLLRSLACCAWSFADDELLEMVEQCRSLVEDNLRSPDPGPWAFALCYSAMLRDDKKDLQWALSVLKEKKYLLEAACFARLANIDATEYESGFLKSQKEMLDIAQHPEFKWKNAINASFPVLTASDPELIERNRNAFPM